MREKGSGSRCYSAAAAPAANSGADDHPDVEYDNNHSRPTGGVELYRDKRNVRYHSARDRRSAAGNDRNTHRESDSDDQLHGKG